MKWEWKKENDDKKESGSFLKSWTLNEKRRAPTALTDEPLLLANYQSAAHFLQKRKPTSNSMNIKRILQTMNSQSHSASGKHVSLTSRIYSLGESQRLCSSSASFRTLTPDSSLWLYFHFWLLTFFFCHGKLKWLRGIDGKTEEFCIKWFFYINFSSVS